MTRSESDAKLRCLGGAGNYENNTTLFSFSIVQARTKPKARDHQEYLDFKFLIQNKFCNGRNVLKCLFSTDVLFVTSARPNVYHFLRCKTEIYLV
jgi:hypothetical protein